MRIRVRLYENEEMPCKTAKLVDTSMVQMGSYKLEMRTYIVELNTIRQYINFERDYVESCTFRNKEIMKIGRTIEIEGKDGEWEVFENWL
jgi:hypothetical protein